MGKPAMKGSPVKSQGCPELCRGWGRTHKGGCPRCWGLEAAERPSAFPPLAGSWTMLVTPQPWSQAAGDLVGLAPGRTVGSGSAPRPPLTPRATGCSSGPGAGTCGDGGTWSKRGTGPATAPP